MNLYDSSFLCLDIGTSAVHGIAHRVRGGRIDKSAIFTVESHDTTFAIKSVLDELERQIGTRFDTAFVTGDFGQSHFAMNKKSNGWTGEHKITASDVRAQIAAIETPDDYFPMHIIPLRYVIPGERRIIDPVGRIGHQLISIFGTIFYPRNKMAQINSFLRAAHIQPHAFFDPQYLQNAAFRKRGETVMFIDLGAAYAAASIWSDIGPRWHIRTPGGGTDITRALATTLNINFEEAERIKRAVASMARREMDRFTPADAAYAFSHADVNDIVAPRATEIIDNIRTAAADAMEKSRPTKIIITGGMSDMDGIVDYIAGTFGLPCEKMDADATVRALSKFIWRAEATHVNAFMARYEKWNKIAQWLKSPFTIFGRRRKPRKRFIPIMPSTLCFDMTNPTTYSMFAAAGLSMVHVDIMDGLYVDKIAGGTDMLKHIRAQTRAHLHVHLMTVSPKVSAADAIAAGADTIIVSTGTSGVIAAIGLIHAAGKRAGIALNPDSSVDLIRDILPDIDDVLVMTVAPGAAGQTFRAECLAKISALVAERKKRGLRFTISVDGGINATTAQMCWGAGADLLVSGSYLAQSPDFPLAVQSLLRKQ